MEIALVSIAVEAGEGKVVKGIGAAVIDREDMVYGERHILPALIGVAVLTAVIGALTQARHFLGV